MPERSWKILLIGDDSGEAARLERALRAGMADRSAVVDNIDVDAALERMNDEDQDLLIVDLDALGSDSIGSLRAIRRRSPGVPLIAVSRENQEGTAIEALQAGAQDCLSRTEIEGLPFARAVRYAIERSEFQARLEEAQDRAMRDRELGGLSVMSAPGSLPVTERSLGANSLLERAPQDFEDLVRRYGDILERALLGRTVKDSQLYDDLNRIADHLGALGAGPRDAVELHKAAVSARLEGQSVRRAKAYVEEGRLLLVQLMGYLVSFYRSLSWGRGPSVRLRGDHRQTLIGSSTASGKNSK